MKRILLAMLLFAVSLGYTSCSPEEIEDQMMLHDPQTFATGDDDTQTDDKEGG